MAQTHVLGVLRDVAGAPQQARDAVSGRDEGLRGVPRERQDLHPHDDLRLTLQPFFDDLIAARSRGLDVKIIFDHSQAEGMAEKREIERLVEAGFVNSRAFVIGTSPISHQLCHIKATWVDGTHVEAGSLNYSASVIKQINTVAFSEWPAWAQYLDTVFAATWEYIVTHEAAYQTFTGEVQP